LPAQRLGEGSRKIRPQRLIEYPQNLPSRLPARCAASEAGFDPGAFILQRGGDRPQPLGIQIGQEEAVLLGETPSDGGTHSARAHDHGKRHGWPAGHERITGCSNRRESNFGHHPASFATRYRARRAGSPCNLN